MSMWNWLRMVGSPELDLRNASHDCQSINTHTKIVSPPSRLENSDGGGSEIDTWILVIQRFPNVISTRQHRAQCTPRLLEHQLHWKNPSPPLDCWNSVGGKGHGTRKSSKSQTSTIDWPWHRQTNCKPGLLEHGMHLISASPPLLWRNSLTRSLGAAYKNWQIFEITKFNDRLTMNETS